MTNSIVWNEAGDHPDVVPFEHALMEPAEVHGNCGHTWAEHGMIEVTEGDEVGYTPVCPGDTIVESIDGFYSVAKTGTGVTPEGEPGLDYTTEETPS